MSAGLGIFQGQYYPDADAPDNFSVPRISQVKGINGWRYEIHEVDMTSSGSVLIATTDSTSPFMPRMLRAVVTEADTVSVAPEISLGTNGSSYDNIEPSISLADLDTLNQMRNFELLDIFEIVATSTGIYINVTTPATANALTMSFYLHGDYQ